MVVSPEMTERKLTAREYIEKSVELISSIDPDEWEAVVRVQNAAFELFGESSSCRVRKDIETIRRAEIVILDAFPTATDASLPRQNP